MGIDTTRSFADISEGTQVESLIADATYDPEGRFGPAIELALDVQRPSAHAGETILSTFGLSQPRLSKVRDLRGDGLDDEAIASVLHKKGFEFENIDDPETPKLGGALLRIVKACYNEDARAIKKLLAECNDFQELADALIGRRFVFSTRKDKNGYTRVDGKADVFRVMQDEPSEVRGGGLQILTGKAETGEEEFDDIPF